MDTVTHGVIGALAARVCGSSECNRTCLAVTAAAAAFPDVDYLLFWIDPYSFITEWHRGVTHSVVMLPLWSTLISTGLYYALRKRISFRILLAYCSLGLLTHIAMDLLTVYGVQLFSPLSDRRFATFTVFDIDPFIGLVAFTGLIPGLRRRRHAAFCLLGIFIYLVASVYFQLQAQMLLDRRIGQHAQQPVNSHALPQPVWPFHRKLIIDRVDYYEIARLSLFPQASHLMSERLKIPEWLSRFRAPVLTQDGQQGDLKPLVMNGFRSATDLSWQTFPKFGDNAGASMLARQAWRQPALAKFRQFAVLPVLYRVDREQDSECVWFTDLRYVFPLLAPPFRYGLCRADPENSWMLFRLRRHTQHNRQALYP